jgi:hypothetical protein
MMDTVQNSSNGNIHSDPSVLNTDTVSDIASKLAAKHTTPVYELLIPPTGATRSVRLIPFEFSLQHSMTTLAGEENTVCSISVISLNSK